MRLLLDTHVILALLDPATFKQIDERIVQEARAAYNSLYVSIASLWEIAIKTRVGKLELGIALADLPESVSRLGCELLPINSGHVLERVEPWPATKDPFDRLLVAICAVEGFRLLTTDRSLANHPLAWSTVA